MSSEGSAPVVNASTAASTEPIQSSTGRFAPADSAGANHAAPNSSPAAEQASMMPSL